MLELAENLRLAQHHRVKTAGDLEEMLDALRLGDAVEMVFKRVGVVDPLDEERFQLGERACGVGRVVKNVIIITPKFVACR